MSGFHPKPSFAKSVGFCQTTSGTDPLQFYLSPTHSPCMQGTARYSSSPPLHLGHYVFHTTHKVRVTQNAPWFQQVPHLDRQFVDRWVVCREPR